MDPNETTEPLEAMVVMMVMVHDPRPVLPRAMDLLEFDGMILAGMVDGRIDG